MKNVLLVGCGNIGFRHLQALVEMDMACAISIIEPAEALHPRINALIENEAGSNKTYTLFSDVKDAPEQIDLAIIATNAANRRDAWSATAKGRDIGAVIFEKVVFLTNKDLDEVGAELAASKTKAYVNCGRRGFPGYQSLKSDWQANRPVALTVTGGGWAMASNAIHFLDIAEYLNASPVTRIDMSNLDTGHLASKRSGYVEVFGRIEAELANGAMISLTCANTDVVEMNVRYTHGTELDVVINEGGRESTYSDGRKEPFESRHVSQMPTIYSDLLDGGNGQLTPYAESAALHKLFIDALRPHLGLSNENDDECPIS